MQLYMRRNIRKHTFGRVPIDDSVEAAHSRRLIRIFDGRIFDSQGCTGCLPWGFMSEGTFVMLWTI